MRLIRINTTSDVMVNQYTETNKHQDGDPFILVDDITGIRHGPFIHTASSGIFGCRGCPIRDYDVFSNDRTHICYLSRCFNSNGSVVNINDLVEDI